MASTLSSPAEWKSAINGDLPAVVEYHSPDCQHCAHLRPTWEALARQYQNQLDFFEVDIETTPHIASAANVTATPTIAVYSRSDQVAVLKGAVRDHLVGLVEATIEGLREANDAAVAGA